MSSGISTARGTDIWWRLGAPAVFLLFWSSGFAIGKVGLLYASPLLLLSVRYACVVAILLPLQWVLRLPLPRTARQWFDLCMVGFLIQFVYFGTSYMSMKAGLSAGGIALIVSMEPILVGIVSPVLVGERVRRVQWFGLALGLAGAVLVIAAKSRVDLASPMGVGLAVFALVGMTAGVLYEKRYSQPVHAVGANLVQCAVGLVFCLPLALATEPIHIDWTWQFTSALAYLVVCNSLISISLLLAMVRRHQAARVSALFFLVPPGAAVMGMLLLGESMPAIAWLGMAIAAAGVWIASKS
jgi:drug/metabolite transporter (DMT)-like permease